MLTVSVSSSIRVPLNITPRPKNLSAHTTTVFFQLASSGAKSGGAEDFSIAALFAVPLPLPIGNLTLPVTLK